MTTQEYLKAAPPGTSRAVMQKIIEKSKGERPKINASIKELWAKHGEDSSWVEVPSKAKKKAVKQTNNNFKGKKPYNNQRQKSQTWAGKSKPRNQPPHSIGVAQVAQEEETTPSSSWAKKLFQEKKEQPKPAPKPKIEPKVAPKPEELDVKQVEAKLFEGKGQEEKVKVKVEETKVIEPLVKPGVSLPSSFKKPDAGNITFGSVKPIKIDVFTLAENQGKEVLPVGTSSKIKQLEVELTRVLEENTMLKARHAESQSELAQSVEQNRKFSLKVQELETAAKEKDNLRDEVSKLTKQLEEHQLQTRQFYDRIKEEPKKEDEKVKPPNQPPVTTAPQQGYNLPQHQQHMYPAAGMQYFPQYYSQFPHYPQNHGPPQSRYNYDSQSNHPPPSHPPGPAAPSPPPDHHGHFAGHSHEEFRGIRRGGLPQPPSRDIGIDKNAQHAPPGYGNTQHQPYGYPPNMVYQQQQQFPPGQGQKWSGGR